MTTTNPITPPSAGFWRRTMKLAKYIASTLDIGSTSPDHKRRVYVWGKVRLHLNFRSGRERFKLSPSNGKGALVRAFTIAPINL